MTGLYASSGTQGREEWGDPSLHCHYIKWGLFIAGDNLCHKAIVLLNNVRVRICISLPEPYHRKKQQ